MSLPTLDEIIDSIIHNKELLAKCLKRQLDLGQLEILDVALECRLCDIAKSHMRYFRFDTFMGVLTIRICDDCYHRLAKEVEAEKKAATIKNEADRLEQLQIESRRVNKP